jgi:thioredoxin
MNKTIRIAFLAIAVALAGLQTVSAMVPVTYGDKPITLTRSEFIKRVMDFEKNKSEWVYKGDKPAIIDFYADWCAPCKKVAPALEELAAEYGGKVYIYKINIDKEPELAGLFGVRNIPLFW